MARLVTDLNLADPDRAYRMLTEAQRGLSDEEATAFATRLLLLLANHVGEDVLAEAVEAAKAAGPARPARG